MFAVAGRKISSKTPVYDHAGELQGYADESVARRLIESPHYIAGGTRRRIRCFRAIGPDPAYMTSGSGPRPGIEKAHRRETYSNPAGVLTFNYLPKSLEPDFRRVLQSVTVQPAPKRNNVVEMPRKRVAIELQEHKLAA